HRQRGAGADPRLLLGPAAGPRPRQAPESGQERHGEVSGRAVRGSLDRRFGDGKGAILASMDSREFLEATPFVDSDAESVAAFSRRVCGDEADELTRAVRLYYAVRDGITYTPYCDFRSPETYRASACLARGAGFCVAKAALLAAAARAAAIPARVGFADVRNH